MTFKAIKKLFFVFFIATAFHAIANNIISDQVSMDVVPYEVQGKLEQNLLTNYLERNGYIFPNIKDMKIKCLDYFNMDFDKIDEEEYGFIGHDYAGISKSVRYLSTFIESIFYHENTLEPLWSVAQAREYLEKNIDGEGKKFITYNKLLFNDIADNEFFLKNPSMLIEIVLYFNYENNNVLYEKAIPSIQINDITTLPYILFYNNYHKGYKVRLLNDLYAYQGIAAIKHLLTLLNDNWNEMNSGSYLLEKKVLVPQDVRDKALLHLLKIVSQHNDQQRSREESQLLAYHYLRQFMDKDPQLATRLQENNYYDMGLALQPEQKQLLSISNNQLLTNVFITQSADNYVNIRQAATTKASVIQQLPNKYKVTKLHTESSWYYVKSMEDDGLTGYIHISQLVYYPHK
jgi:hypothetical protein